MGMHPGQVNLSPDMPNLVMPAMTDARHHNIAYHHHTSSNNVNTLLLPGVSSTFQQQHHSMGNRLHDGRANRASPTSPSVYSENSSAFVTSSNVGLIQHHHQPDHIQQQQQLTELLPSVIGQSHMSNINHHTNELNGYFKYETPNMYNSYGE